MHRTDEQARPEDAFDYTNSCKESCRYPPAPPQSHKEQLRKDGTTSRVVMYRVKVWWAAQSAIMWVVLHSRWWSASNRCSTCGYPANTYMPLISFPSWKNWESTNIIKASVDTINVLQRHVWTFRSKHINTWFDASRHMQHTVRHRKPWYNHMHSPHKSKDLSCLLLGNHVLQKILEANFGRSRQREE